MQSTTSTSVLIDTADITKELRRLELVNLKSNDNKDAKSDFGSYKSPFYASRVLDDDGVLTLKPEETKGIIYKEWEPVWNTHDKFPPYEFFEHRDRGLDADPSFENLFPESKKDSVKVSDLTPKFGSEVTGLQLSELSDAAKDDLALLVAERGVLYNLEIKI